MPKTTTKGIRKLKGVRPIVCVTAYDTIFATLADRAGIDLILVGDSVGNTVLGFETTVPVTVEMMVHHTAAVTRAKPQAMVVADVPFAAGRYDFDRVLETCCRLLQEGGAEAVKIEGGARIAPMIERLVHAGVPVLGHIGLLPQRVFTLGGYRKFGKDPADREALLHDAMALQDAGVFAIIGEMMDASFSAELSKTLAVPFIGIGCGPDCDGQILVSTDLLGLNLGKYPGFVKQFARLGEEVETAFRSYVEEVRDRRFPEPANQPTP